MRAEKKNGASTPQKQTLPRPASRPKAVTEDDGDPDFDADEDIPNPFSRVASSSTPALRTSLQVKCDTCDEKFPDAKSRGIHKTLVHFGR